MLIVVPGLSISFLMFFTMLSIVYSLFVSVISVLPAITLCLCFVRNALPVSLHEINLFSQERMYALTVAITTNTRMCNV